MASKEPLPVIPPSHLLLSAIRNSEEGTSYKLTVISKGERGEIIQGREKPSGHERQPLVWLHHIELVYF